MKLTRKNIIWLLLAIIIFATWVYLFISYFDIVSTDEELQEYANIATSILNGDSYIFNNLPDKYNISLNEGKLSISGEKLGNVTVKIDSKGEVIIKHYHEYLALVVLALMTTIITMFTIVSILQIVVELNAKIQNKKKSTK